MAMWLAHTLLAVYFLIFCINGGIWYFGTELQNAGLVSASNNPFLQRSENFTTTTQTFNATAQEAQSTGFNPLFVFGDFGAGITWFWSMISGGYLMNTTTRLGFPLSFQQVVQTVILGFAGVAALIYYISGRQ